MITPGAKNRSYFLTVNEEGGYPLS